MAKGLWLSDQAFDKIRDLNYLLVRMPDKESEAIKFGKEHYQTIAGLRDALERILAADMLARLSQNGGVFLTQRAACLIATHFRC